MFGTGKPLFTFRGPLGIPVQIGSTILLLPLIFIAIGDMEYIQYSLTFVALLIGSIFLHELGHAMACRAQGVPVRRIVLHGGGGFCEHVGATTARQQELIVAMGPVVNLVIWAIASLVAPMLDAGMLRWAVHWLATINLFLALFNLLPVQPLDGGKLFRLGLMRLCTPLTATRIAGTVGFVFSILWLPGMLWLYLNVGLVLLFFPPIKLHYQMMRLKG
jgi:stage IV sporulation protein FB